MPIPGTTKLHRLEENLGAAEVELTLEDLREVDDAASEIEGPGWALSGEAGGDDGEVGKDPADAERLNGRPPKLAREDRNGCKRQAAFGSVIARPTPLL